MAWLVFGWARPAFPADALAPEAPPTPPLTTQINDDASADSQPVDAVTFLGTGAAASPADAPADKPASSLRLAPIAIGWGGNIGYRIEQRNSGNANATLRQRATLTLRGQASSYIWQPWMAQVKSQVGLTSDKSITNDIGSSNNAISGIAGLYLVPYSRFPFTARISRNQNYSGPGIGSLSSQSTRFGMSQRYTPRHKKESYQLGYNRSLTESGGVDSDRQTGLNFNISSGRFYKQTLNVDGSRDRGTRHNGSSTQISNARVQHRYRPSAAFSVTNNAYVKSSSDHAELASTITRNRELNSTASWQPTPSPYSMIGSARVNVSDNSFNLGSSHIRTANAGLSANYRASQYINLSAGINVNATEINSVRTHNVTTSERATASYPLAAFDLDVWRYTSQFSGSIGNSTDRTGSVQSISLSPSHNLRRNMDYRGGALNLGLNQLVSVSETTRSQAVARLTHSATANWRRAQGRSNTSLSLSGRDTRSLSSTQDTFQNIGLGANISEQISRNSTLSGNLSVQAARQANMTTPNANVYFSSSASLRYNDLRAFNTPRLTFNSDVRVYSKAVIPVLVASPNDQGPISWENTLSYVIGLLTAEFKVNLSRESDGLTQSLIALSLKRYF